MQRLPDLDVILKGFIGYLVLVSFLMSACSQEDYYKEMLDRVRNIERDPKNLAAWGEIEKLTASPAFWTRYYAFSTFVILSRGPAIKNYTNATTLFENGLQDSDSRVQILCVEGISNLGFEAVNQTYTRLLQVLSSNQENSLSWATAECLGKISDQEHGVEVLNALLLECEKPVAIDTQIGAPRTRTYALSSAVEIARQMGSKDFLPKFEKLKKAVSARNSPADREFAAQVTNAVSHLKE